MAGKGLVILIVEHIVHFIKKACPCNVYPLGPHLYITKLGYAGIYLFFVFLLQNIDCGYWLEPPRRKTSKSFLLKIFNF